MDLVFDTTLSAGYENKAQVARVLTESWAGKNIFCPNCGNSLAGYENNRPIADFYCLSCSEEYELKSKSGKSLGKTVADGSYKTMIQKIKNKTNPSFFFLNYKKQSYQVVNFLAVPSFMFMPNMIVPRNKGIPNRQNYIMCNIDISSIPNSGKIFFVKNGQVEPKNKILDEWNKTLFLRDSKTEQKSWLIDIMMCIDKLDKKEFSLQEFYTFVPYLKTKHPNNNFIKDKIRQQLQVLRDKRFLKFTARGKYEVI